MGLGGTVWGGRGRLLHPHESDSAPSGWVCVVSADGEDVRLHAPEDVAIHYNRARR